MDQPPESNDRPPHADDGASGTSRPAYSAGGGGPIGPGRARGVPIWLYVLTGVLFAGLVAVQRPSEMDPKEQEGLASGMIIERPDLDFATIFGKLMFAAREASGSGPLSTDIVDPLLSQLDTVSSPQGTEPAPTAQDAFRTAVLFGEFKGVEAMEERFERLTPQLDPGSALHQDMATATSLYAHEPGARVSADSPVPPQASEAEVAGLIERHGWVGKIAARGGCAWGGPASADPALAGVRAKAADDGRVLMGVVVGIGRLVVLD